MRSEPLILNKKGNLKYPKVAQTGKEKMRWILIATDETGKNRGKKYRRYRKAKQAIAVLSKKHQDWEFTIVSRQVGYGPPRSKVSDEALEAMNSRGRYWCPFCRKFRVFDEDPWWGLSRCPVCGIFDTNWHVIHNNPRLGVRL